MLKAPLAAILSEPAAAAPRSKKRLFAPGAPPMFSVLPRVRVPTAPLRRSRLPVPLSVNAPVPRAVALSATRLPAYTKVPPL